MKITCLVGNSYLPIIAKAGKRLDFDIQLYSTQRLEDQPEKIAEALKSCQDCDLIFIHRGSDGLWDEIEPRLKEIGKNKPIVCLGYDHAYWMLSTAPAKVVVAANAYLTHGGEENICNMLLYLCRELLLMDVAALPLSPMPWEGAYHPDAPHHFDDINEYLKWYAPDDGPVVGLLFSRFYG